MDIKTRTTAPRVVADAATLTQPAAVPHGVGRLRAAEVYAQALAERLTLLAYADAAGAKRLGAQLVAVESACNTIEMTVRPVLQAIDPAFAHHVAQAADIARQRGEAMGVA